MKAKLQARLLRPGPEFRGFFLGGAVADRLCPCVRLKAEEKTIRLTTEELEAAGGRAPKKEGFTWSRPGGAVGLREGRAGDGDGQAAKMRGGQAGREQRAVRAASRLPLRDYGSERSS